MSLIIYLFSKSLIAVVFMLPAYWLSQDLVDHVDSKKEFDRFQFTARELCLIRVSHDFGILTKD